MKNGDENIKKDNNSSKKKLKKKIQKLSKSIERSGDIIINTDRNGIITYVNKSFCDVYGYRKEDVVGKVTPRILNSGNQSENFYKHFWDSLLQKNRVKGFQFINKCKNGKLVNVEVSADAILDNDNEVIGFLAIQRDVTKRVRGDKIQSVILNISNISQGTYDLGEVMKCIQTELGKIVDTTNFYVALYKKETDSFYLPYYTDEKDDIDTFPAGKSLTSLVIKEQRSLLLKEPEMDKLSEQNIIDDIGVNSKVWLGVPIKTKDTITGVFVVQSYVDEDAFSNEDMHILEIISQQISITVERNLYEEKLMKALEKSQESERLKSAFLANMSHEIRTPMNAVLGFTDLLKDSSLTGEKQKKYIDFITKSGNRLLKTINDIVDISKIEAGILQINNEFVNINDIINEVLSLLQPELLKKNLQINVNYSLLKTQSIICTDPLKIYTILENIIKNAIKFTSKGCIEINCSTNNEELLIKIKDTGIGIPISRQVAVFERFVKADIEDKGVYEGSGLGLAIAKSYIEILGGKLWLESKEGVGSTFSFKIPLKLAS